jgi:hypothetical protein
MTIGLPSGSYLVLTYDYVPDIAERRGPHRPGHLEHARQARERGELVAIGALGTPPTGALLVFTDVPPDTVKRYAELDPYQQAGLVTGYRVSPWTVVG